MSVDYSSVGGIGIKFTDEMKEKMIDSKLFTEDEWDDSESECMEEIGISYYTAGNSYSGNLWYYFLVEGSSLEEINKNVSEFISKFKQYNINISQNDLQVISDLHVW